MKVFKQVLVVAVVGLFFVGCVTNGDQFSSNVEWIKTDTTEKAKVRQLLGEPYSIGNSAGKETWTYGYYRYKLIGKSYQKELKFYWNPDGTVNTFSFNSSFPDDTGVKK
jgi:hypothetical protein